VAGPADRDGVAAPRLEKLLEGALVKVSSVASKLTTLSAQGMINAMIAGQRDPHQLAALARTRMKAKHEDLVQALDGMFDDHHGELAALLLDQIALLLLVNRNLHDGSKN
jgi:transposase